MDNILNRAKIKPIILILSFLTVTIKAGNTRDIKVENIDTIKRIIFIFSLKPNSA